MYTLAGAEGRRGGGQEWSKAAVWGGGGVPTCADESLIHISGMSPVRTKILPSACGVRNGLSAGGVLPSPGASSLPSASVADGCHRARVSSSTPTVVVTITACNALTATRRGSDSRNRAANRARSRPVTVVAVAGGNPASLPAVVLLVIPNRVRPLLFDVYVVD